MGRTAVGWASVTACFVAGLVAWYFVSMLLFHYGWERLDPMCRESPYSSHVYVIDGRYSVEAAEKMKQVIATLFSEDAVSVDESGFIYIRPALYYGYYSELHRFAQLVVRPEDEPHLYQTRRITCDELQPLLRFPIDDQQRTTHKWPFSLYVLILQPEWSTLERWQDLYKS